MKTKSYSRKIGLVIVSAILSACIIVSSTIMSMAAQKISNPDRFGGIDGIDYDPEVGRHNSYAWCSELFEQTDGDYLWCGMNRDLGGTVFSATGSADTTMLEALDIPVPSADNKGKIYRVKMDGSEQKWELVYENPAISGYRKMIIYKDDLYVCAGMSNRTSGYHYSIILRFSKDFKLGDSPEIVMWETLSGRNLEYFRSAYVYNDLLYVGTFDSKLYVTDGEGLENLTPNNLGQGEKHTGWDLAIDLKAYEDEENPGDYISSAYIWDIVGYNGFIYAFLTSGEGFMAYRLTPGEDGTFVSAVQVVGKNENSPIPAGMGIDGNAIASPFIATVDGQEYVYVTTFANGPQFLIELGKGNLERAFDELFCPASIYRFDEDENWEVVVGDTTGALVAKDRDGNALPNVGNQRSGFFPGVDSVPNVSANQYIWWMAEYQGKLYASTWDTAVFKDYASLIILNSFIQNFGIENVEAFVTDIKASLEELSASVEDIINTIGTDISNFDVLSLVNDVKCQMLVFDRMVKTYGGVKCIPDSEFEAFCAQLYSVLQKYCSSLTKSQFDRLCAAIISVYGVAETYTPMAKDALSQILSAAFTTGLYFIDKSNPAGFDLFSSDDGVNFEPVTVSGFGDKYNYGGRVLLPTKYGMFVATANPFFGGQMWRLDPMITSIDIKAPESFELKVGEEKRFPVYVTRATEDDRVTLSELKIPDAGQDVEVKLVKVNKAPSIIKDVIPEVTLTSDLLTYGGYRYDESFNIKNINVYTYELVFTAKAAGSAKSAIEIKLNKTVYADKAFDITITSDATEEPTTVEPDTVDVLIGDIDKNGEIQLKDATLLQLYLSKKPDLVFDRFQLIASDVDDSGAISLKDVTAIQLWLANSFVPATQRINTIVTVPAE